VWALSVPVVRAAGFLLVMSLALRALPPAELGLWYVLSNLSMIGGAVEMGLSLTLARFASYFMAGKADVPGLGLGEGRAATGQPLYGELAGLVLTSRPLYRTLGLVTSFNILVVGGLWLLYTQPGALDCGTHLAAFLLTGLGAGLNMSMLFWWPMLNGMNKVRLYHILLLAGMALNYAVAAGGILAGGGITALVAGFVIMNLFPRWASRRKVLAMLPRDAFANPAKLRASTFWPMTWRTGMASFTSYLCVPATTLVCAHVLDLEAAGSYGLSLQIALLLHAFAASWLTVKLPQLAQLQARRDLPGLLAICRPRMALTLATYAAAAAVTVLAAPWLLQFIGSKTALLPAAQLAAVFAVVGLDLWVGMHAALLQTGNEVPHLRTFVASGILSVALGLVLGARWGVWGVIAAPFAAQAPWNYWWTPWLFWRKFTAPAARDATREST